MHFRKIRAGILALVSIVTSAMVIGAQQAAGDGKPAAGADVVSLTSPNPILSLLPDTLAGYTATSDRKLVGKDGIAEFVADKTPIYRDCLLYTSPSPRDRQKSRMPSSA